MTTMNVFDMSDTWNSAGTTFTAIKMTVTDTASAAGSMLLDLQVGGTSVFSINKAGGFSTLGSALGIYNNGAQFLMGGAGDLILARDAANTLALRNGLNSQVFRVYQTFTSISQNAYLNVRWAGTDCRIQTTSAGAESAGTLTFGTSGVEAWRINASNHLVAVTDNTFDIGATGANRPRNIYVGTLVQSLVLEAAAAGYIGFDARSRIRCPADGQILLRNNAENNFSLLQFGGSTSSFPSLKRNGTALETKLADDSAYAPHAAQYLDVTDGITAPGAATGRARIYVDTADGDLKVIFADGTIKTIVTDT